jgi:hypothetical protein
MKKYSSEIVKLLTSVCPFLGDLIDTTNLVIGDHMLQDKELTKVRRLILYMKIIFFS